jgi:gas vesicle protein
MKGEYSMAADDCAKGLIIGGLIGAALGILYAPKSGKETREEICKSTGDALEKAKKSYEEARKKIENVTGREKALFSEKKEKLKKALDAGLETFKKENVGTFNA